MRADRDQSGQRPGDGTSTRADDATGGRRAFDDLRLVAAVGVILSHSFHLTGSNDPLTAVMGFGNLGTACVIVFMALSGHLVTQSWEHDPRIGAFFAKRALRILPALVAVVAVTALVIGPLVTTESVVGYARDPGSWRYLVDNLALHPDPQALPGVFATNPERMVNTSLWTLPYEVTFYFAVPLALITVSRTRRRLIVATMLGVVTAMVIDGMRDTALVWTLRSGWLFLFGVAFLSGALLRSLSGRRLVAVVVLLCAAAAATSGTSLWPVSCTVALATLAVAIAHTPASLVSRGRRHIDLSYGLYLWGYPVQQLIVSLTPVRRPLALFAIALPIAVLCAAGSWKLVESPALRLKTRLRRGRAPASSLASPLHPHQAAAAAIS